mgnify:CR=1 FL=1
MYFSEIRMNNQPKNKAEEAAAECVKAFNKVLFTSKEARDHYIEEIRKEVKEINAKNPRCRDVTVSRGSDLYLFKTYVSVGINVNLEITEVVNQLAEVNKA